MDFSNLFTGAWEGLKGFGANVGGMLKEGFAPVTGEAVKSGAQAGAGATSQFGHYLDMFSKGYGVYNANRTANMAEDQFNFSRKMDTKNFDIQRNDHNRRLFNSASNSAGLAGRNLSEKERKRLKANEISAL